MKNFDHISFDENTSHLVITFVFKGKYFILDVLLVHFDISFYAWLTLMCTEVVSRDPFYCIHLRAVCDSKQTVLVFEGSL